MRAIGYDRTAQLERAIRLFLEGLDARAYVLVDARTGKELNPKLLRDVMVKYTKAAKAA